MVEGRNEVAYKAKAVGGGVLLALIIMVTAWLIG